MKSQKLHLMDIKIREGWVKVRSGLALIEDRRTKLLPKRDKKQGSNWFGCQYHPYFYY